MPSFRRILLHSLVLLAFYESLRLLFWIVNRAHFQGSNGHLLWQAFVHGARYDFAAIALTNGLLYIFYLVPLPPSWLRWQERVLAALGGLVNCFFLSLNIVDIEYFRFTGKRFTWDSFSIGKDILGQINHVAVYYWYYTLLILLFSYGLVLISWRILRHRQPEMSWSKIVSLLAVLALAILAGRGGWQHKPLIPAQAYAGETGSLGLLILNSSFTVLKSSDSNAIETIDFMPDEEARRILKDQEQGPISSMPIRPKNVVLIIMESFGKEYVFPPKGQPSFAPFLQSLAHKGSFFAEAFANGRRSIDALPAIFAGIPAWMESPFITSPYQTNSVQGYPALLRKEGFHTRFFHGGDNGTMFFDVMADRFGFDEYVGAQEYPDQKDHDGRWGIFDEPFLQYVVQRLGDDQRPFFASIFTLSSHHPYTIPQAYQGRFPKGQLEIHESLGYADLALQKFYESAQKQAWFKDTLFIFTADHTQKTQYPEFETAVGRYRVPLIFIMNDGPLPFPSPAGPAQHLDIMPTVLDALGVNAPLVSRFGSSLLRSNQRPGIVLFDKPRFLLLNQSQLLSWNMESKQLTNFDWPKDVLLKSEHVFPLAASPALTFLKAEIQCFNNGMVQNKLLW